MGGGHTPLVSSLAILTLVILGLLTYVSHELLDHLPAAIISSGDAPRSAIRVAKPCLTKIGRDLVGRCFNWFYLPEGMRRDDSIWDLLFQDRPQVIIESPEAEISARLLSKEREVSPSFPVHLHVLLRGCHGTEPPSSFKHLDYFCPAAGFGSLAALYSDIQDSHLLPLHLDLALPHIPLEQRDSFVKFSVILGVY